MFFKRKDPFSSETIGNKLVTYVRNNAQQLMYREVFFNFVIVSLPEDAQLRWKPYKEELRSALIKRLENTFGIPVSQPIGGRVSEPTEVEEPYHPTIVFLSGKDKISFSGSFEEKVQPDGW